ncbi:unnamed protein product [Caenorhabditis angaria]|uniref:DUF19 domain-containing protein n=1 Tax=Caenorhabditis angaria TaxID=860376 RepID=A0A9P1J5G2_9PELO|nr:unnamed protein product [Caenorhabditis angaria]
MILKLIFLTILPLAVLIVAAEDVAEDLICPFYKKDDTPCLRSDEFKKFLENNTEEINARPDLPEINETKMEIREREECCYEVQCLTECQINLDKLAKKSIFGKKNFREHLDNSFDRYPGFFRSIDWDEMDAFRFNETEKLAKINMEHWKIRVIHLYLIQREISEFKNDLGFYHKKLYGAEKPEDF